MHRSEYQPCEQEEEAPEGSDSRQRIVLAAYPLFVEAGYDAVSMQEIADSVPLHKATLYHHFQSKDDLFLAVVRMAMSRLYRQIQGFIVAGGSASDQLTRVAIQVFQDSQSEFGRLMTDARLHLSPEQQTMLVERCADPWMLYEELFTHAIAAGELPVVDTTLAATMFAGLLQGQTWALKTGRIEPPLDQARARLLVDTLFGGLNAVFGAQPRPALLPPVKGR
jgi:AcrR family transcriptional regulator